jgi:hypothetical protein
MGDQPRDRPLFFQLKRSLKPLSPLFCDALNVAFAPSVDNLVHASSDLALRTFEERIELWRARLLSGALASQGITLYRRVGVLRWPWRQGVSHDSCCG